MPPNKTLAPSQLARLVDCLLILAPSQPARLVVSLVRMAPSRLVGLVYHVHDEGTTVKSPLHFHKYIMYTKGKSEGAKEHFFSAFILYVLYSMYTMCIKLVPSAQ